MVLVDVVSVMLTKANPAECVDIVLYNQDESGVSQVLPLDGSADVHDSNCARVLCARNEVVIME